MILQAATAREVMTPGPYSIDETETVDQAATFFTDRGLGSAVVIDLAGHPVGVITKTDLLIHLRERAAGVKAEPATVREVMTEAVFSVKVDTPTRSVVEQLLALNVHHLFVVDSAGVVVGVITPTDVLRKLV